MTVLNNVEPKSVFRFFEEISGVPRASYNTKLIGDYLEGFAKEHKLSYIRDEHDNVLMRKAASPGYEAGETIILQGHSDMVAEEVEGSTHDFAKDGLELKIDGDFLRANGTTLGGDDGIAVAIGLAILDDDTLMHPALEVLITSNEEVGLLGAAAFDTSVLKGERFINLDSGEEGVLLAGCAGGRTSICSLPIGFKEKNGMKHEIIIDGLKGGHSGVEIDKNRANANALMGRLLHGIGEKLEYSLAELSGGKKDNIITNNSQAMIVMDEKDGETLNKVAVELQKELRKEYAGSDDEVTITVNKLGQGKEKVLDHVSQGKIIFFLMNVPFGVYKMSGEIAGLVETSSNIGAVKISDDTVVIRCSIRSMVQGAKSALADKIKFLTEFLGGEYNDDGDYPAWEFRDKSPLRDILTLEYQKMFDEEMKVEAIHAGLECGLFYDRMQNLDCVSIGPNIYDVHSSNEHLSISSTERTWKYLLQVLASMK